MSNVLSLSVSSQRTDVSSLFLSKYKINKGNDYLVGHMHGRGSRTRLWTFNAQIPKVIFPMIINCFAREVDKVVQLLFAIAYCPGRIRAESRFVWVASDSVTFFNFLQETNRQIICTCNCNNYELEIAFCTLEVEVCKFVGFTRELLV